MEQSLPGSRKEKQKKGTKEFLLNVVGKSVITFFLGVIAPVIPLILRHSQHFKGVEFTQVQFHFSYQLILFHLKSSWMRNLLLFALLKINLDILD